MLNAMNRALLQDTQCLFGGGTAIALQHDEFRLSNDIDFICSSHDGYRKLRGLVGQFSTTGLSPLFDQPVSQLREARADRYGIRSVLEIDGTPIKFEIVREDRLSLDASVTLLHGVPTISRDDAYAEKLLANSDRWADRSVASRDILDLAAMVNAWGDIPPKSLAKACSAYGTTIIKDVISAANLILDNENYCQQCFDDLRIDESVQRDLLATLRGMSQSKHQPKPDGGFCDHETNGPGPSPS